MIYFVRWLQARHGFPAWPLSTLPGVDKLKLIHEAQVEVAPQNSEVLCRRTMEAVSVLQVDLDWTEGELQLLLGFWVPSFIFENVS